MMFMLAKDMCLISTVSNFTFLLVTNLLLVVFLKVIFKVEFWWRNKHFFLKIMNNCVY